MSTASASPCQAVTWAPERGKDRKIGTFRSWAGSTNVRFPCFESQWGHLGMICSHEAPSLHDLALIRFLKPLQFHWIPSMYQIKRLVLGLHTNQFIVGDALQPPANRWEFSNTCRAHGFGTLRISTDKPPAALPSLAKAGSSLLKPEFTAATAWGGFLYPAQ